MLGPCSDDEVEGEDDGNLTSPNFAVEARWLRLLAAAQLHYLEHRARVGGEPLRCRLCLVYTSDWWD